MLMRMLGFTMNIAINGASYINHKPLEEIDSNIKAWDGCHPVGQVRDRYGLFSHTQGWFQVARANGWANLNQLLERARNQHELINMYGRIE